MSACVSMSHVSVRMCASARLCTLARTCLSTLTCGKLEIDVRCFSQSYLYLILCLVNFFLFFCLFFRGRIGLSWNSLCTPGCPGTHSDPPASASPVLRLKACTTVPDVHLTFWDRLSHGNRSSQSGGTCLSLPPVLRLQALSSPQLLCGCWRSKSRSYF